MSDPVLYWLWCELEVRQVQVFLRPFAKFLAQVKKKSLKVNNLHRIPKHGMCWAVVQVLVGITSCTGSNLDRESLLQK